MRRVSLALILLISSVFAFPVRGEFPVPQIPCDPQQYLVQSPLATPVIDGRGDDLVWDYAAWTDPFVDIQGLPSMPAPRHETRVRMLWDPDYLYIYAWMEEPHLWATYDQHDMVIYHENDFEVFIDPDGDNHNYLELEVNALGTTWDLMLTKPYRDGGFAVDSWEIPGLKLAVHLDGTLNDPSDIDNGWGVEMAIPWDVIDEVNELKELSTFSGHGPIRVNFSRVQWRIEPGGEHYVKQTDPSTGKPYPEDNWVWSPQGLIAMHYPEMWGIVAFQTTEVPTIISPRKPKQRFQEDLAVRSTAMQIYYAQKQIESNRGAYAGIGEMLELPDQPLGPNILWPPEIVGRKAGFETFVADTLNRIAYRIREDGRLVKIDPPGTFHLQYMKGVRSR